ncbi:alpha/beta hydrolase [Algoriphagus namhaensis]|uniref:Alpha/beta hydrolase n=1 Tax=Algoriphagus namhaensis TaxID=915353 RepID=A0ABV8AV62_9BACT
MNRALLILISILFFTSCAFRSILRDKEITYTNGVMDRSLPQKELNVFSPKKGTDHPVLIFYYGGSWESGKKEIYDFMGSRLARRGLVVVIPDYPLAPDYQINDMENAGVEALLWAKYNVAKYGGDPDKIIVNGHSAGAHLASLLALKDEIWDSLGMGNPIAGAILNDPAGLDMKWFLEETRESGEGERYYNAFTDQPDVWEKYSTIYYLDNPEVPTLILEGERTYPGIRMAVARFRAKADSLGIPIDYSFHPKKKHIPMITQYFWTWSQGFDDILDFVEKLD